MKHAGISPLRQFSIGLVKMGAVILQRHLRSYSLKDLIKVDVVHNIGAGC
jgi:hypothetical protein